MAAEVRAEARRLPRLPRPLLVALLAALGFWAGNVGAQYIAAVLPAISLSPDAPEAVGLFAFLASAFSARPLGVSLESMPMAVGALAAVGVVAASQMGRGAVRDDIKITEVHGDEELATVESRRRFQHREDTPAWPCPPWCETVEDDNIIITQNSAIAASSNPDYKIEQMCANRHVFIMGASGRGKTYTLVGPNILQLNGSYVFTDPKGELFRQYAGFMEANGYKVECLNLRDEDSIGCSSGFNPLAYTDDLTSINQAVLYFIENTTGEDHGGDKRFFTDMETAFYTAVIGLFVFWFKKNGNMADCNMPAIIDYLLLAKADGPDGVSKLDLIFEGDPSLPDFPSFRSYVIAKYGRGESVLLDGSVPEASVLKSYGVFKANAGDAETMSNVISSCASRLSKFNNPAVRRLLSRDELDLDRMGREKRALFLGIKAETGPYDFIAAMAINQMFDRNIAAAANSPSGHLDVPVWCWLDELANVGKIPNLEKLIATTRSYWINLVSIVQDGEQLKARYGDKAKSVESNSSIFVFLGSADFDDCERVSKKMGNTTRIVKKVSKTENSSGGGSVTVNYEPVQVPLMSPAELYNFHPDSGRGFDPSKCLTHYFGADWFLDTKFDLKTHRRYGQLKKVGDTDFAAWSKVHRAKRAAAERLALPAPGRTSSIDLDRPGTVVVDLSAG